MNQSSSQLYGIGSISSPELLPARTRNERAVLDILVQFQPSLPIDTRHHKLGLLEKIQRMVHRLLHC